METGLIVKVAPMSAQSSASKSGESKVTPTLVSSVAFFGAYFVTSSITISPKWFGPKAPIVADFENTYIGSLCVSHHNILLFRFLISSHLFLLHGRIDHLSDKYGDLIVSVAAHSENTMVIQKSVASNEVGTGYVYPPSVQDQVGVVSSNGLDQYFYTSAPTQKPEKKPEAFVFNFAKGSMPTVHIHPKP
ncbi:hypothetical protein GCK72_021092 [Caenorhabditis remanei]|uniref:Uncharacterized protein n=1 Tax=Caenorhabditis remanei TaxID=31234 RepID=A0A6A5GJM3_CAERE|nr:hypothetical protein GCK72_021092 [Caenorhabditis remanei]KAF1754529.1 hypothetical protein GCK72_021092 [Caenorhabditis remanei]